MAGTWAFFRDACESVRNGCRVTCGKAVAAMRAGRRLRRRKILPRRHQLPGSADRRAATKKSCFIGFFAMARRLLIAAWKCKSRAVRHLLEFCHAVCPWRRVVRTGCPPIADVVEIVVVAVHRLRTGSRRPVRSSQRSTSASSAPATGRAAVFADIAGHHERAAGGAKPVIDRRQPPRLRPAGPTRCRICSRRSTAMATARSAKRIRKRARRRRHQPRAGRRRVQQARHQWRRLGQPRRNVVGAEGSGRQGRPSPSSCMSAVQADGSDAATSADGASRSAAAGAGRRDLHVGDQQRRLDHDIDHLCRRHPRSR